ncbi:hypothetical protein GCM10009549_37400 [Streptomyces thermoalcalitolerans]|uniref:Uncharacterized protein n=1 Tax=Streptomyces thermoalcalitolerans TaxID=65605 RepID=A0ABN1NZC6_9ACTN
MLNDESPAPASVGGSQRPYGGFRDPYGGSRDAHKTGRSPGHAVVTCDDAALA